MNMEDKMIIHFGVSFVRIYVSLMKAIKVKKNKKKKNKRKKIMSMTYKSFPVCPIAYPIPISANRGIGTKVCFATPKWGDAME